MVGNFIADHVKGKQVLLYSEMIQKGIQMHRDIDQFTDHHPIVKQSKERLYPKYHKYAAVIVDMFYDHLLARNWSDYSPIQLRSFASSSYQVLNAKAEQFPEKSRRFLYYMSKYDWLSDYAQIEGIGQALNGLAQRTRFESKMEEAIHDLQSDYTLYKKEFDLFFPELCKYSSTWLSTHE